MRSQLALMAAALLAISFTNADAMAQLAIEKQKVTFAARADSSLRKGQLMGDRTIDYILRAGAGQTLKVDLKAAKPQAIAT